jgi:FixJ family two-component response regulator
MTSDRIGRSTLRVSSIFMPMPSKLVLAVVDDDQDIRRALGRMLKSCGHVVYTFESAEAYLAEQCHADCAILDIQLPGISGLELEERMKEDGGNVGVVFITAHDEPGVRAAIQETRRPFLKKPFDEGGLLHAIATATGDSASDLR